MGNLLNVLNNKKGESEDIFLDFENAEPSEVEKPVFELVEKVLERGPGILSELKSYSPGARDEIKDAISNPGNVASQQKAWATVCPLIVQLKGFWDYSVRLEEVVPRLLGQLCGTPEPLESLRSQQALAKELAEILHFVLKFDDYKMATPEIQNDFSYYRRQLSRQKMAETGGEEEVVSTEEANRMSLFYAVPTPMLKSLCDSTAKYVRDRKDIPAEATTDILSTMCQICRLMVEPGSVFSDKLSEEIKLFVQRVMVGLVVVYDWVHPVGAFAKKKAKLISRGRSSHYRQTAGHTQKTL